MGTCHQRLKPHTIASILAIVVTAYFGLINIPGQLELSVNLTQESGCHFDIFLDDEPSTMQAQFKHGWPLTYLIRAAPMSGNKLRASPWRVGERVTYWSPLCFAIDALAALAIGILAVVLLNAWHQRRHRLNIVQFQSAELLVIVTLAAVCCAFVSGHIIRHRGEVAALRSMELPTFEEPRAAATWQPGGPTWLRQLLGDAVFNHFDHVIAIEVDGTDLEKVVAFPRLKMVQVTGAINQQQLDKLEAARQLEALVVTVESGSQTASLHLPKLPHLRRLDVSNSDVLATGLENIPSVEVLELNGTRLADSMGRHLAQLERIKVLNLADTLVGDGTLQSIVNLDHLSEIDLSNTGVSNDGLRYLAAHKQLRKLWLANTSVSDEGLKHLSQLTSLEALSLSGSGVGPEGLKHLGTLQNLRHLYLEGTKVNGGLPHLAKLGRLQLLSLADTDISDRDLRHIAGLQRLEHIILDGTEIGDSGVCHLSEMPRLQVLRICETKITDASVPYLTTLSERQLLRAFLYETQISQRGKSKLDEVSKATGYITQFMGP